MAIHLNIAPGQEETVEYSFNRKNPTHTYSIAYYKKDCVKITPDKTTKPEPKGIETHYVFCGKTTDSAKSLGR